MKMKTSVSRGFVTELLKDVLYPELCPICGEAVPIEKRAALHLADMNEDSYKASDFDTCYNGLACPECIESLSFIGEEHCGKCGKQIMRYKAAGNGDRNYMMAAGIRGDRTPPGLHGQKDLNGKAKLLCVDCQSKERSFTACRCLLNYDGCMREIMADIKYNSKREYLRLFAVLAADRLGAWIRETGAGVIVPVPVHSERMRKRGFNQAAELAEYIGGITKIPVRELLKRNRNTAAQKELNSGERLFNLQGAFTVQKAPEEDRILIVDDIFTTGSTLEACSKALLKAGAAEIYGLCICAGEDSDR